MLENKIKKKRGKKEQEKVIKVGIFFFKLDESHHVEFEKIADPFNPWNTRKGFL